MNGNIKFGSNLDLTQAQKDFIEDGAIKRNELSKTQSKIQKVYAVADTVVTTPGLSTPVSFNWANTESWNASNIDVNIFPRVLAPSSFVFQKFGNITGLDLYITSTGPQWKIGTGGTQSLVIEPVTAGLHTIKFEWNADVQSTTTTGLSLSNTTGLTGVTWTAQNPAAIIDNGSGGFTMVVGQTTRWIQLSFTAVTFSVKELTGDWELQFGNYGGALVTPVNNYTVSSYVINGLEYYEAVQIANPSIVLTGAYPIPGTWTEVNTGAVSTNIPNSPNSTLAPVAISNLATGGVIGTSATTVDVNSMFVVTQTTAGQTLTLPNPTSVAGARLVTVQNSTSSTQSFVMYGQTLAAGASVDFIWNGVSWSKIGADATTESLTYGRVNALLDLASTTHVNTDPGTKIPFTGTVYTNGMTVNAGSIIPSVSGRYRADWLCMATSTDFLADGIFFVVQNGVSLGQVSYNMNEASAVNQSAGFIDVNLVAGQEVALHYRTRHTASDGIAWDRGSYFQLTQLPTAVAPVVDTVAEYIVPQYATANVTPTSVQNTSANAAQFMAINIPSAGTWDIEWSVLGQVWQGNGGGTNDGIASGLYDAAGTFIANTELASASIASAGSTTGSNLYIQGTRSTIVITTEATTYNVKVWNPNGLTRATAGSGVQGRSYIKANKIAGQLPSTGQTVDLLYARQTTTQGAPTVGTIINLEQTVSGNIPFVNNTVTLSAGKTYKLEGAGAIMAGGSSTYGTRFYNVTTNQFIGDSSFAFSPNNANTPTLVARTAMVEITPTVTTQIQLRVDFLSGSGGVLGGSNLVNGGVGAGSNFDPNGASWMRVTQLGSSNAIVTDNVALFGEQSLTATTIGNATVDITNGSFTLPSAGTWEVEYFGNISLNAGNIAGGLLITDASNVEVANSRSVTGAGASGGGNESAMVSNKVRIITSAPTTYKIRGIGNSATIALSTGLAIGSVANKVTWNLITGTVPSTGQTVDYLSAKGSGTSYDNGTQLNLATLNGNISQNTGIINLTAGKTYRLQGSVRSTNATIQYQWRDILSNTLLGVAAQNLDGANTSANTQSIIAEAVFTPSVNTSVRLENTTGANRTIDPNTTWVTVTQLGSTSNTVGTLPALDQSGAGYFDIGNMRMQWGTLLHAPSTGAITFPTSFANTNYTVVVSSAAAVNLIVSTGAKATTNFSCTVLTSGGSPSTNNPISYYAIGQKP